MFIYCFITSCEHLSGSLCQAFFPETFTNVIRITSQVNSEEDTFNILAKISPLLDDTCRQWMNLLGCSFIYHPCNENGEWTPPCDGECERIVQIILGRCQLEDILKTSNFTVINSFLATMVQFNCSDPVTYLIPSVPVDNSSCFSAADLLNLS